MAKLFDADGNEVEAYTADELAGKQKEAVDAYLKDHPDQSKALTEAQDKVKKLEEDLKNAGLSDGQKKRLIEERDGAIKSVEDLTKKFTEEMSTFKNSFFDGIKKKGFDALSQGKTDVREKLVSKFESLMKSGDYPQTEEGITTAMREAATIVNGNRPAPGFLDGITSGGAGDRGGGNGGEGKPAESANSAAMRKAFGITDQQAEKFGPKS